MSCISTDFSQNFSHDECLEFLYYFEKSEKHIGMKKRSMIDMQDFQEAKSQEDDKNLPIAIIAQDKGTNNHLIIFFSPSKHKEVMNFNKIKEKIKSKMDMPVYFMPKEYLEEFEGIFKRGVSSEIKDFLEKHEGYTLSGQRALDELARLENVELNPQVQKKEELPAPQSATCNTYHVFEHIAPTVLPEGYLIEKTSSKTEKDGQHIIENAREHIKFIKKSNDNYIPTNTYTYEWAISARRRPVDNEEFKREVKHNTSPQAPEAQSRFIELQHLLKGGILKENKEFMDKVTEVVDDIKKLKNKTNPFDFSKISKEELQNKIKSYLECIDNNYKKLNNNSSTSDIKNYLENCAELSILIDHLQQKSIRIDLNHLQSKQHNQLER